MGQVQLDLLYSIRTSGIGDILLGVFFMSLPDSSLFVCCFMQVGYWNGFFRPGLHSAVWILVKGILLVVSKRCV
jgi:hypothetical protein